MKKIEKKLRRIVDKLSFKLLYTLLGISFFLVLLSMYGKDILKEIEVGDIAAWTRTIENLAAPILPFFEYIVVKILVWIVFILLFILSVSKAILRPKAIVISHSTFSNTQSSYDGSIAKGLLVDQRDINLVDSMRKQDIVEAIRTQDRLVSGILRDCDEYTELFYYGIAHIPLIFRAGYQIGDEGKVRLLHKYRNEQSVFKEISTEADNFMIELIGYPRCFNKAAKELLVVVATSFPVSPEDLSVFRNNKIGYELRFEMKDQALYGVDSIDSYAVMNRLRAGILSHVREIVASENIEKIHLVLSTSSDFTFFLSQGFSKYHDPEVIVYQYERSNAQKYPWGISNKAFPASAIILQKK